uniref:Uncharacterized protein n=2 Tax=Anopheles stephensi TaxID=30069 RepID=A0A182XZC0_ANOST
MAASAALGRAPDTITLSAISNRACSCGAKPDLPGGPSIRAADCSPKSSPDDDIFHHTAPNSSNVGKQNDSKHNLGIMVHQLSELTDRIGNLESSLKHDIRTILEILHQQQQLQMQIQQQQHTFAQQHQQMHQMHTGKTAMSSYQPSESDFSFDMCGAPMDPRDVKHQQPPSAQHRIHVARSVSQPECSDDRSLFK